MNNDMIKYLIFIVGGLLVVIGIVYAILYKKTPENPCARPLFRV